MTCEPLRRIYDLRHAFATFALRASLTMIDCHYGHLTRDGRDHAIPLLAIPPVSSNEHPICTIRRFCLGAGTLAEL